MNKLVVVIMGQNCEKFINMCLESIKNADNFIYCDGGSTDKTLDIVSKFNLLNEETEKPKVVSETKEHIDIDIDEKSFTTIMNEYDQKDLGMNGKQRNFYLDRLKEIYPNYWCLVLDADEILEDFGIQKIKQTIEQIKEPMILSPRIHHFVGDLGHEDATQEKHFVPNRLFKITTDLFYPQVEHPVLHGSAKQGVIDLHIWHLRECLGVFETSKKFQSNMQKTNMHSESQLRQWNRDMLLGSYPTKKVHYDQLPSAIKIKFGLY